MNLKRKCTGCVNPCIIAFLGLVFSCSVHIVFAEQFDMIIRNASIIDGTNNPRFHSDVAIRNGSIAKVGPTISDTSATMIEARGMILAPGFIDVHTHLEQNLAEHPAGENFIRMGVTSVITGNCGSSALNIREFLANLRTKGVSLNVGTLIGHGTVRNSVLKTERRAPDEQELDAMRKLVDEGMRNGAFGLSTGLIYVPGTYAKTEELIELAKIAAKYSGVYATHMRDEGNGILDSIRETLRIGKEAQLPVEISHLKISSKKKWGQSKDLLRIIQAAREGGMDVTADQYAYTASSTSLGVLLPSWTLEGGIQSLKARLNDPAQRRQIKQEMLRQLKSSGWKDYSYAYVAHYRPDPSLNGRNIPQITKLKRRKAKLDDQMEQVFELMTATESRTGMVYHKMSEKDVAQIMQFPFAMIASDSGVIQFGSGVPHPRGYGNNPRVLGEYVRNKNLLSLEDAIRKMTSLPAQTFGLKTRGLIREGMKADLVLFEEKKVNDLATFKEPHQYPAGITLVVVNGVPVFSQGAHTGAFPGEILFGRGKD